MKIKAVHSKVYDTEDVLFWREYLEYMDDHTLTVSGLMEFIEDRFINPNFDEGTTTLELVEEMSYEPSRTIMYDKEVMKTYGMIDSDKEWSEFERSVSKFVENYLGGKGND